MFRRPTKNPHEKEGITSLYQEETNRSSSYPYGAPNKDSLRTFDSIAAPTPLKNVEERPWANSNEGWNSPKTTPLPHPFQGGLKDEEPETTLGEGVTFRGELHFERCLKIDGLFEGKLISKGKVIVGPKGSVKADLNLKEAIIEGKVMGNITVEGRLELRQGASVEGDIKAASLCVDDGVRIIGLVEVNPSE